MPSTFEEIVAEIHAQVPPESAMPFGVLRLAQDEHQAARHVTWVPLTFETRQLDTTGPIEHSDGLAAMYLETWSVEAHIVGDTLADAELIRAHLLKAAKLVLGNGSEPTGGIWVTQALGEAALSFGGLEKVVQRFRWELYMFEPSRTGGRTTVQQVDTTAKLPPDSDASETFTQT